MRPLVFVVLLAACTPPAEIPEDCPGCPPDICNTDAAVQQSDPAISSQSFRWEGAAAGTGLAETPIMGTSGGRTVERVVISAASAVAADGVDYAEIRINAWNEEAVFLGTTAIYTTQSFSLVPFTTGANEMVLGSGVLLPDNAQLTLGVVEGGAGVPVPPLVFTVSFSPTN